MCVCVCTQPSSLSPMQTCGGPLFLEVSDSPASHSQVGERALIFLTWRGWERGLGGQNPSNWDITESREILVFGWVNTLSLLSPGHKRSQRGLKKIE